MPYIWPTAVPLSISPAGRRLEVCPWAEAGRSTIQSAPSATLVQPSPCAACRRCPCDLDFAPGALGVVLLKCQQEVTFVNLILFEEQLDVLRLAESDPRTQHIRKVLKMGVGDELYVGVIDGVRGKARIMKSDSGLLELEVSWEDEVPHLQPLILLAGLPRPQTARVILREGASLGFEKMVFFGAERGEPSYSQSNFWTDGECHELLKRGAAQAFNTRLPEVTHHDSLVRALQDELLAPPCRFALDLYEARISLAESPVRLPAILAIGAERGWSSTERDALRASGFTFAHLGDRVLRSESASLAAGAILLANGGGMTSGWGQKCDNAIDI